MARELTFAIVTPYTIRKSRTGAVLARLLGRTSAELIGTQMFALSQEEAEAYAGQIRSVEDPEDNQHRQMIREYILQNFSPAPDGRPHRTMLLAFCGENAYEDVSDVVGKIHISSMSGETIRDTFGDMVYNDDGSIRYFEPAVLTPDRDTVRQDLQFWLGIADKRAALLDHVCAYRNPDAVEQTLVLIKPDSWREKSSRPGAVIDMFSRTGLRIIAAKLVRMSVRQALNFYGPVKTVLQERLAPGIGRQARQILESHLGLRLPDSVNPVLAESVGRPYACDQFERIVEFMTGMRPSDCSEEQLDEDGKVKCLALVYEGENAVSKIRAVLGPTDPTKAPGGTVRREFGSDIMVNTAHASDSPENAQREMAILKMCEGNLVYRVNRARQHCLGH